MIRHVITWKLNGETRDDRLAQAAEIKARLEGLTPIIPEILSLHVGIDRTEVDGQFDAVLISDHADISGLRAYQAHPDHLVVAAYVREQVSVRGCVDYEV